MLHVTPTPAVACVPTHVPASHPDAELLALAPALDAAFQAFDHHRRTDTRGNGAMYDERRVLFGALETVAGRILAIRPQTMPGLLLMARAAAAASDWLWDPEDDDADREGRALRTLCDAIFALAGTDRHGRTVTALVPAFGPASHPDAELMDLWRRRELASAAAAAARDRLIAIKDAMVLPESPEALFACDADEALGLRGWAVDHEPSGRPWYPVVGEKTGGIASRLRRRQVRTVDVPFPEGHALHGTGDMIARQVPWPEAQARADAIVAAWDGWRARLAEIYDAKGFDTANEEWEALDGALAALDGAIEDTPARTLDGVRIKAQLAHLDLDKGEELWAALGASLVRDLVALPRAHAGAAAAPSQLDAALLALEPEFLKRMEDYTRACAEEARVEALIDAQAGTIPHPRAADFEDRVAAVRAARIDLGYAAVERAREEAHRARHHVADRIRAIRPNTLYGLRVKAMTLRQCELDPDEGLIADILAMTEANRNDHPIPLAERAVLSAVVDDLERLDREIRALSLSAGMRDAETMPGYLDREAERDAVLQTLIESVAGDASDLKAKARALRTPGLVGDHERHIDLALSLAEDVERLSTPILSDKCTPQAPAPLLMAAE